MCKLVTGFRTKKVSTFFRTRQTPHRTKKIEFLKPPHILHIWFCPDTQSRPFGKTKRAKFSNRTVTVSN